MIISFDKEDTVRVHAGTAFADGFFEVTNVFDLLKRISNGASEIIYDFLTTQILSVILIKKGNKEIIENAYQNLAQKYGEEKSRLKIADFNLTLTKLADRIRKNLCL